MADRGRDWDEKLLTRVQTIGIIMAAIWAIGYTFFYLEIFKPTTVPVNVSINLKFKKTVVSLQKGNEFAAIEMQVLAKNPSTQITYLLPGVYYILAYKITDPDPPSGVIPNLREDRPVSMMHYGLSPPTFIGCGYILSPDEIKGEMNILKPGEERARTFLFYVPVSEYDVIKVEAKIPNGTDLKDFRGGWGQGIDRPLELTIEKLYEDNWEAIKKDENGNYPGGPRHLQQAESSAMISLR